MKRSLTLVLSFAMGLLLLSCAEDGEQGAAGLNGPAGSPQPVDVIVLISESSDLSARWLALNLNSSLPPGSELHYINVRDSIPPLSVLRPYDAVVICTNSAPLVASPLGDRLADYIDAGGKMVMLQFSFATGIAITGRITDSVYAPFTIAASAGDAANKTIDNATLTFPLHPILVGIDVNGYTRIGVLAYSVPGVRPDAVELARFNGGLPAIAINANGNIVAINDFPIANDLELYPLVTNAILFMTGRL